jgi:putative oxidoreductase
MKKSNMTELGFWALRLTVGGIFTYAGWEKLANMDKTITAFSGMGISAFWTWVASIVEFVGGLAVLLGVAVHVAAGLLAITMIVALFVVLRGGQIMMAYAPLALFGSTLALFGLGGGSCQLWKMKGCTGSCCKNECGGSCGDKKDTCCTSKEMKK